MFKVYKTDKKKRKEELIYERYEEKKDKLTLKRDELYKILNEEFSKYCYDYSPLTPLNIEILMNNIKEVETLLSDGNDINEKNAEGLTPLSEAVILNNYDITKYLIENGADIKGTDKFMPLMISAEKENDKIMELLLENGADANELDVYGFNALQHLFNSGQLMQLKSHTGSKGIPFHYLYKIDYQRNQLNCINLLADAGIDINHTTTIDYQFNFKEDYVPIDINALTLALNNVPVPSQKIIKRLIELGIEPKAYELISSRIYDYQDSFNFIQDIKDLDISCWKDAPLEYLFYLKYLRTIKKFNIEMYTGNPNDGYRRSKLIKTLKKD